MNKPCIDCGQVTASTRCPSCLKTKQGGRVRPHYSGDYAARAKAVRDTAQVCWICGEQEKPGDPWQADHVIPGAPDSPLAPAHRSCNIARSNRSRSKQN